MFGPERHLRRVNLLAPKAVLLGPSLNNLAKGFETFRLYKYSDNPTAQPVHYALPVSLRALGLPSGNVP
jgi:hypothetical protein